MFWGDKKIAEIDICPIAISIYRFSIWINDLLASEGMKCIQMFVL